MQKRIDFFFDFVGVNVEILVSRQHRRKVSPVLIENTIALETFQLKGPILREKKRPLGVVCLTPLPHALLQDDRCRHFALRNLN